MNNTESRSAFLIFTLYAPIGAFGSTPMGTDRPSWPRPGRAAVLGLAAGALGILRTEERAHLSLDHDLHYAVRTDAAGLPLGDYHTTQAPGRGRNADWKTRRDQLRLSGATTPGGRNAALPTILSNREYRTDCLFTAALWKRPGADDPAVLERILEALQRPAFTPCLGRKASPLGLPLDPAIIEAPSFLHALMLYPRKTPAETVFDTIGDPGQALVAADADAGGLPPDIEIQRRADRLASRARWQYRDRDEAVFTVPL
jgi:CRISPR system Cascade subunit CasD